MKNVRARFAVASAESLPFQANHFDLVVTESVNVFVDVHRALLQYHRILKPGGYYVDVEMLTIGPVTDSWRESARRVYGARIIPDLRGWKRLYQEHGFDDVSVLITKAVKPEDAMADPYPDDVNLALPQSLQNADVQRIMAENAAWMDQNHRSLGYGVFLCRK